MTPTAINPEGAGSIMESLYALRENPEAELPKVEAPKTEAAETPANAEAKTIETDKAPVETKQELNTDEEDHSPLPPKAQKRVDKLIAETVSLRKELEAKLKAAEAPAKQGTEPVKTGAETPDKPKRPTLPQYGEGVGNENESWTKYQERQAAYHADVEAYDEKLTEYIVKVTEAETQKRFTQKQAREAHEAVIAQATKDHGEDFLALTQQVADHSPVEFQHALLDVDDWPTLAVYLARNPDKLLEVVEKFKTRPIAAIETLGRMRAGLKGASPKSSAVEKALPAPLKPVAGNGSIQVGVDLQKLSEKPGAMQSELRRIFPDRVIPR